MSLKLAIVTCSIDPERTRGFWETWRKQSTLSTAWRAIVVINNPEITPDIPRLIPGLTFNGTSGDIVIQHQGIGGVVPMYYLGVQEALRGGADIIACFHDDLAILEPGWDSAIVNAFERDKKLGLVCFSGAMGIGDVDIYKKPYSPNQLARINFISNMVDAEKHGERVIEPRQIACGDGFSQIGSAKFFKQAWEDLQAAGIKHHFYDTALGCLAYRYDYKALYLPVHCKHHGGLTAVGNLNYARWAAEKNKLGDHGFWEEAHLWGYEEFRDVLPIRLGNLDEHVEEQIND